MADLFHPRRIVLGAGGCGYLAALVVLALIYLPGLLPVPASGASAFPSTVAPYSWYTGMLSRSHLPAATLLYQNGVGVEFRDDPQSVLLGTNGSSYRRLDEAERGSVPTDQGDPAGSLLSADGTFVVIGSSAPTGALTVVRLQDGQRRRVPVLPGRVVLPISIGGANGQTVLLATTADPYEKFADGGNTLHLVSLDLTTGRVREYPGRTVEGAALSPDGQRIALNAGTKTLLLDAASGRQLAELPGSSRVAGDAWSPDGRRIALIRNSTLIVADVSGATPSVHDVQLSEPYPGVLGWRDGHTVLVYAITDSDENTSAFSWADADTGVQQTFSTYTPNFTGAALVGADAARDLIGGWQVGEQPVDRGPLPLVPGVLLAVAAGLVAALVYRVVTAGSPVVVRR